MGWESGSDSRWRTFRAALMLQWRIRGRTQCEIRGRKCTGLVEHVDHIAPLHLGGTKYDETNCRPACAPCNVGRRRATPSYEPPPRRVSTWSTG